MPAWSVPIRQGWKLRVLSGTSIGKEFDLAPAQYVLGSRAPSSIVIPDPSIAPQHVVIDIHPDHIQIRDCSGGVGVLVNGVKVGAARLSPGDQVTCGNFNFGFSNPGWQPPPAASPAGSFLDRFTKLPLYVRAGAVTLAVAVVLYILLAISDEIHLVPVTLLAMSAVVPATMICFLVEKYDRTGLSFHTLALTFLAGGTVGVISAMVVFLLGGNLLSIAVFAGLAEEPAKLLATSWRWRHRGYDRPMDGLIIGTVCGFGFAVFETAGYGLQALVEHGVSGMLLIMVIRGLSSPFGHGLWSGNLAAAFWQCGRDVKRAVRSRVFLIALAWSVGLHALWNGGASIEPLGYGLTILSAALSVWQYRRLLANKGFRP